MGRSTPKISVLVPVYGVEQYIERCARSIFGQTYDNLEIIFVDDCTPDRSMEILRRVMDDYPQRKLGTKILKHSYNKGLAAARKTAIAACTGEYCIHCDSDDWVELEMYERLCEEAKKTDADIVGCDFFENKEEVHAIPRQFHGDTPLECIKAMLTGKMHGSVWNKLMRRSFIKENAILPPVGYDNKEDLYFSIQAYAKAGNIAWVDEPLYHYRMSNTSMSRGCLSEVALAKKIHDSKHNVMEIESFLRDEGILPNVGKEMNVLKARVKNDIFTLALMSAKDFRSTFPGASGSLSYFSFIPRKIRILQRLLLLGS